MSTDHQHRKWGSGFRKKKFLHWERHSVAAISVFVNNSKVIRESWGVSTNNWLKVGTGLLNKIIFFARGRLCSEKSDFFEIIRKRYDIFGRYQQVINRRLYCQWLEIQLPIICRSSTERYRLSSVFFICCNGRHYGNKHLDCYMKPLF